MKKEIADKLEEMQIDEKVNQMNVHMSDAFLESCLKNPQKLDDAMKKLEEVFNTPVNKENGPNRSYVFLVMGDKTKTISTANHHKENFKNTGMYWEKDFTSSTAKAMKTFEDATTENIMKLGKKLEEDLMYRNLKDLF